MWHQVTDIIAIKELMDTTNFFHDSCIKEIRYISGAYVDNDLFMSPTNTSRKLSIIIQRQACDCPVIELEFSKLKCLRLLPLDEEYTSEIYSSTLLLENGFLYWFDCGGILASDIDRYEGVAICAQELRWRTVCGGLGEQVYFEKRSD